MSAEEEFYAIALEACEQAAAVKCDVETYRAGLRGIMDEVNTSLDATKNDG